MILTDNTVETLKLVPEVGRLAAIAPANRTADDSARATYLLMRVATLASDEGRANFQKLLEAQGLAGAGERQVPRNPWPAYEPAVPGGPPRIVELLKSGIQGEWTWDQRAAAAAAVVTKPIGEAWEANVAQPARAIGNALKWTAIGLGGAALVGVAIAVARSVPPPPSPLPPAR